MDDKNFRVKKGKFNFLAAKKQVKNLVALSEVILSVSCTRLTDRVFCKYNSAEKTCLMCEELFQEKKNPK